MLTDRRQRKHTGSVSRFRYLRDLKIDQRTVIPEDHCLTFAPVVHRSTVHSFVMVLVAVVAFCFAKVAAVAVRRPLVGPRGGRKGCHNAHGQEHQPEKATNPPDQISMRVHPDTSSLISDFSSRTKLIASQT
jgi:hypothetical protein